MTIIPIFIIVHDHLVILKKMVQAIETQIKTPFEIVFHDVASTYQPTLIFLEQKRREGYCVYRSEINNHHSVLSSIRDYHYKHGNKYYVMTDADIELDNVNGDILEFYVHLLETHNANSVGPMLLIHDIPDYYPRKINAMDTHYKQFWGKVPRTIKYKDTDYKYIQCNTDTTFQLSSMKNMPSSFPHANAIRCYPPYAARHLDWYLDPNNLTDCQRYYLKNTTSISHWANPRWSGKDMCNNVIGKL